MSELLEKDYFIERGGQRFAGLHILLDFYEAKHLSSEVVIKAALQQAAEAAKATILFENFHPFEGGGIAGVLVLAESHISIHTWPEKNFAAIDVFMCGETRPEDAVPILRDAFEPNEVDTTEVRRGVKCAPPR